MIGESYFIVNFFRASLKFVQYSKPRKWLKRGYKREVGIKSYNL